MFLPDHTDSSEGFWESVADISYSFVRRKTPRRAVFDSSSLQKLPLGMGF
jgi:hypothetical protein